jgi:hypothetical protein
VKDTLNSKQNILIAGNNITIIGDTISSTGGITQEQLDSIAKLDSVNTFIANQNISGDLKANNVVVLNTTPTLDTQLTSKLYVDTAVNKKQNTLTAGDNITISGNTISSTGNGITQADLDAKQNKLDATSALSVNSVSTLGNITAGGTITTPNYTFSTKKTCFRITRSNFTLPVGNNSLLTNGTVTFQNNVTLSSGIFIATVAGVYCVTVKVRLPDNNSASVEIQWNQRATNGTQTQYEAVEMWIPAGNNGRRVGMSQTLINLAVGQGVLPMNGGNSLDNCYATFEGFLIQ